MDLSQKLRMQFHDFKNRLQYEPVEVKYYFKDLQYSPANNSSVDAGNPYAFPVQTIFSDALTPDLLQAEKVYGILSRAKTLSNIVFPPESRDSIKQRVLKRILLPNGSQLDNDFDNRGRLIRTHYPDGVSMIYNYDDLGHLSHIKSTNNMSIDLNYDARGRIAKIRHSREGTFQYNWDAQYNLERIKYPDGSEAHLVWDCNSRLSKIKYETEKMLLNRDRTGRLIGVLVNNSVDYGFPREINRKIYDIHWVTIDEEKVRKVITPVGIFLLDGEQMIRTKIGIDGQVTIYRYNKAKNLESIWDYGGATSFEIYEDKSSSIVNSGGLRTLRVVDSERPIVYMIDPFGVSMESYNEDKKTITLVNDKGMRVIYKYDTKERLKSIYNPIIGKTSFAYTKYGLLKDIVINSNIRIELFYLKNELFSGFKIYTLSNISSDFLLIFLTPIVESIISKKGIGEL